jgi:hypothetical protein
VKKFDATRKVLISEATYALIADLDQKCFFSPIHQVIVRVLGTHVTSDGRIIARLRDEADVAYWWSEWQYQSEEGGSR